MSNSYRCVRVGGKGIRKAPEGRKKNIAAAKTKFLPPLRGLVVSSFVSHGCAVGYFLVAAPRLCRHERSGNGCAVGYFLVAAPRLGR